MRKYKLVQKQLNALCNEVLETNVIDNFATEERAIDHLTKRGYKFDDVQQAWIHGNVKQYPVYIEAPKVTGLFDIRSFV